MNEEKTSSISYLPAWEAKPWETAKSSWKKPPAYGAYLIDNPNWSTELHNKGLILNPYALEEIFQHGMYEFYVHMVLLDIFPLPFLFFVRAGENDTTYYPHFDKKKRRIYEQFVEDAKEFLAPYYHDLIKPLGIIFQRWKIVEEFLDKNRIATPEVTFLKDTVQTLIRTILETLITEYFSCIRKKGIKTKPPAPPEVEKHMEQYCLFPQIGLDEPKKAAMYEFLTNNTQFFQKAFPQNNLDNAHYDKFVETFQPQLKKMMHLPIGK